MTYREDREESNEEFLSRNDPDSDLIYETWRDRQGELLDELNAGPWRRYVNPEPGA